MIKQQIQFHWVNLGCDPEFFFKRKGKIIGAEKVLPQDGLKVSYSQGSKFIIDGVQAEMNTSADSCRARIANQMQAMFKALLLTLPKDVKLDWDVTVKVTKKEFMSLSPKYQALGCMPSFNAYREVPHVAEPTGKTNKRWAGGHVHLGAWQHFPEDRVTRTLKEPERLVRILDILVGNTCVLLDRDPGNKERRKTYGKAGEYRTPPHGVEYRTLSNFWLKNPALMSFVFGLCRMSVNLLGDTIMGKRDFESELLALVSQEDIEKAINQNDFTLAMENFKKIETWIDEAFDPYDCMLSTSQIKQFHHVVKRGIKFYFRKTPEKSWVEMPEGHHSGWDNFINTVVAADMQKMDERKAARKRKQLSLV